MKLPNPPQVRILPAISPSLYESARLCSAKAAYQAFGDRKAIPPHPSQLLGTAYHALMEKATLGQIAGDDESARVAQARLAFDQVANELFEASHPLLRIKFDGAQDMPFYALFRERASQKAGRIATETAGKTHGIASGGRPIHAFVRVETELYSKDRKLRGRPDLVRLEQSEVVDYKSGSANAVDQDGVRDPERRQLALYGYLLQENNLAVASGVIERGSGASGRISLTAEVCEQESAEARATLERFNASVPEGIQQMARPTPEACAGCNAIPQCNSFWEAALHDWAEAVGGHAEGTVRAIAARELNGVEVATIALEVERGTTARGLAALEQVPLNWMKADGSPVPVEGDRIRIVDLKVASETPIVFRADRTMTAVWVPSQDRA